MKINILYGSSCVGKSTLMRNMPKENFIKIEMDDCEYWRNPENQWEDISIEYLKKSIINNINNNPIKKTEMVITCGGLPLPTHEIYNELSEKYNIKFFHILIICKNMDIYKKQIIKRGRVNIIEKLINDHKWRENNKDIYDKILINLKLKLI